MVVSCCCPRTEPALLSSCMRRTAPLVVGLAGGLILKAAAFAKSRGFPLEGVLALWGCMKSLHSSTHTPPYSTLITGCSLPSQG
eukprot:1156359-Pelagomonas_calceolata.AAC.4